MPATVRTRGVLKASTNRVRTSTALQGNAMWENVIGITEQQAGTNTGVEALINAPTIGAGRKATQARRQAAAEAVMATGGFDTSITNYQSLLAIAKQQGAVGAGSRGACKTCGQLGHLTKQCRNTLAAGGSGDGDEAAAAALGAGGAVLGAPPAGSDSDGPNFSDSSDEERRRKKRRKEKKRKDKEKKRRKEKKAKKEKKSRKEKKKRRHSSSSGSSSSGSDSD